MELINPNFFYYPLKKSFPYVKGGFRKPFIYLNSLLKQRKFYLKGINQKSDQLKSKFVRYNFELSEKVWTHIESIGIKNFEAVVNDYGNKTSKLIGFKYHLKLFCPYEKINKFFN